MVGDRKDYDELAWQEVARQTAAHCQSEIATLAAENAALREKLAERDALLLRCQRLFGDIVMGEGVDGDEAAEMHKRIDTLTGGDNAEG